MFPLSSSPSFKTTRWVIESTLCHTTSCPAGTLEGFGEKDCAPLIATTLMTTAFEGTELTDVAPVAPAGLPYPLPAQPVKERPSPATAKTATNARIIISILTSIDR